MTDISHRTAVAARELETGGLGRSRSLLGGFGFDCRSALRGLFRDRGTTVLVALTLALGIGATTAIFSALRSSLLAELPYRDADELVMLWLNNERQGIRTDITSYPSFELTREQATTFADLAVYRPTRPTLSEAEPEQVPASRVSARVFSILGTPPALGRVFESREDLAGQEPTVILGDGLWRRRFGGDRDVIGHRMLIEGNAHTIVGVMPPGFDFPGETELWLPMSLVENDITGGGFWLYQVGRLQPDVSVAEAQAEMETVAASLLARNPRLEGYHRLYVQSFRDYFVGEVRTPLLVLAGAALLVLLIACSNVAHLLLARSAGRERDLSVRLALGATRGRLVRLLMSESVALALVGGVLGAALAVFGLRALVALGPAALTRLEGPPVLDAPALAFSLTVSLAVGLLVGVLPALQVSGASVTASLKDGGHGTAGARHRSWLRRGLVSGEVALALVLLVCAGLLLRSFDRLLSVDRGFQTAGVVTMEVAVSGSLYPEPDQVVGFYRELIDRVGAIPGVDAVGATSTVLLPELANSGGVSIEGQADRPEGERIEVTFDSVTPGYFDTVGMSLLAGRGPLPSDDSEAARVAFVNEAMARRYWESADDAVGRRFKQGRQDRDGQWFIVAGVVGDARRTSLERTARPSAYFPHTQRPRRGMTLTVLARGSSGRASTEAELGPLAPTLRAALRNLAPRLPLGAITTLESTVAAQMAPRRFNTVLLASFAGLALFLALVGIYGVVAQWVGERTREIGVRMALGADRGQVVRWVLSQGLAAPAVGLVLGLGLALVAARALRSLLFEVGTLDPMTYALVPLVVLVVATAAILLPAWRACRLHPAVALRQE